MRQLAILLVLAACSPAARQSPADDDDDTGHDAPPIDQAPAIDGAPLPGTTYVYAHTATELYKIDPETLVISDVGAFSPFPEGEMTDLAIDKNGRMIGVSFTSVYLIDPTTAATTLLASGIGTEFNGLSFVPATFVNQSGDDVLVGTSDADDSVTQIIVSGSTVTTNVVGHMSNGYTSSGDMVAVEGSTLQTVPGTNGDLLVSLHAGNFLGTPIGTGTGFNGIWGIGYWDSQVFGFTQAGQFITIDTTTGVGTLVQDSGPSWYGAAVTTSAPIIGRTIHRD
ncbi:MAG TPA: hypothetical protein VGM88_22160 [Kofleriaceae bacterium]|jgi:hypothetical protein